jgi:hypothetical protein
MQTKDLQLKRALRAALIVLLLGVVGMVKVYAEVIGNIVYYLNSNTMTAFVMGHKNGQNAVGSLNIPTSVVYMNQTYTVTLINDEAFKNCTGLSSLTIPNTITIIGSKAFKNCTGLTGSLTIPNSVTEIGYDAFWNCSGFTGSLTISNSLETIENGVFANCSGFTGDLTIPNSVTEIKLGAFYGCSGFTGSLTIPNSVTTIESEAFCDCSGLTGSLTIPNSVTIIESQVFRNCSGFTGELIIPNSVTEIEGLAFMNCSGFTGNLIIPNSVTLIGDEAFWNCSGFTDVLTIGNSVMTIGENPFVGCSGLEQIVVDSTNPTYDSRENCNAIIETNTNILVLGCKNTIIPNSVTEIGDWAFYECSGLMGNLIIGDSVITIGEGAFYGCSGLTGSPNLGNSVTAIGSFAFYGCSGFSGDLVIGNSVTAIGNSAFYGCSGFMGGLTIGNSVTTIVDKAFWGCSGFTSMTILPNNPPVLGYNVFHYVHNSIPVYVQCGSLSVYQNANGWKTFYNLKDMCPKEITTTANPEEGGIVTGAGIYDFGATATLTATANEGYAFLHWTKSGEEISTDVSYSFTVIEDVILVANFELNSYEITVTANPEACGTVTGAGTYNHFETCTLTATAATGYHFVSWTLGGEIVSNSPTYSFEVTGPVDYMANFELNSYEIDATTNPEAGGTVTGAGTYYHFDTCTLTATVNTGYHFLNWTLDGETVSTELTYSFEVTGPADYVANFELNSYEVTAVANPTVGGTITGAGTYNHFTTCTLTATANEGYSFVNWTKNGEVVTTELNYSFEVTEAASFVANFSLNSYEITVSAIPTVGGTVTGAGTYNHFETCTLTATAATGYHFVSWTLNGEIVSNAPTYSFEVTGPADYVANFELNSYEVTAVANPTVGGVITGAGTYNHGATAILTATANENYVFTNWTLGDEVVSTEPTYSFNVTNDANFVANFELTNITQTTTFNNGWTWWSTCIETAEADVLGQLKTGLGVNGQVIKSQTASTMHLGNNWVGSLTMTNESGYMVKSNGEVTVDITGPATTPENHPISLNSGWTWIGYPCTETMTVAEALANHTPQPNDVIKGQNASAMFMMGQWRGALTLTPGIGLMYKSNSNAPVTLTYATPSKSGEAEAYAIETHWNANHNAYPTNMTVLAVVELDGKELAHRQAQGPDANYELAAFANGECRGSVAMMYVETLDRYMALLTISGEESDIFHFALYNTEMSEECFNADETLTYETDAVIGNPDEPFVIRFRSTTGVDEWANSLQVFPNPVEHGQTISFGMTNDMGEVQVEIINALGAVVEMQRTTSLQTLTAPKVAGVYTLKITVEGKGTCYRKLVVR